LLHAASLDGIAETLARGAGDPLEAGWKRSFWAVDVRLVESDAPTAEHQYVADRRILRR
jgi:hypothetical protein